MLLFNNADMKAIMLVICDRALFCRYVKWKSKGGSDWLFANIMSELDIEFLNVVLVYHRNKWLKRIIGREVFFYKGTQAWLRKGPIWHGWRLQWKEDRHCEKRS